MREGYLFLIEKIHKNILYWEDFNMFSKSARKVYNDLYLYTNDIIVKKLAKNWIKNNSYYKSIYDIFGIKIKKHFRIKIEKMVSPYTGRVNTLYKLSCGIFNANKLILKECC